MDPVKKAIEMAERRAGAISDDATGGGPGAIDGNFDTGNLPVRSPRHMDNIREDTGLDTYVAPSDASLYDRLSPQRQAELAEQQIADKVQTSVERNRIAMESERFALERRKRMSYLIHRGVIIIGTVLVVSFTILVGVLAWTGWKSDSLSDTSVLGAIITAVVELIKFLGGQ